MDSYLVECDKTKNIIVRKVAWKTNNRRRRSSVIGNYFCSKPTSTRYLASTPLRTDQFTRKKMDPSRCSISPVQKLNETANAFKVNLVHNNNITITIDDTLENENFEIRTKKVLDGKKKNFHQGGNQPKGSEMGLSLEDISEVESSQDTGKQLKNSVKGMKFKEKAKKNISKLSRTPFSIRRPQFKRKLSSISAYKTPFRRRWSRQGMSSNTFEHTGRNNFLKSYRGNFKDNSKRGKVVVSQGPTMYNGNVKVNRSGLRPIVIDGSNVAMEHGRQQGIFSSKGIKMVVDYFLNRGHKNIVTFVPQFRNKCGKAKNREILDQLYKKGYLVFTPSRETISGRITSYDDTFILDYAAKHGGVVISRDNYRDLANEKSEWRDVVEEKILMPTFVGEHNLMWPHDPLGKHGPNLDQFLKF